MGLRARVPVSLILVAVLRGQSSSVKQPAENNGNIFKKESVKNVWRSSSIQIIWIRFLSTARTGRRSAICRRAGYATSLVRSNKDKKKKRKKNYKNI